MPNERLIIVRRGTLSAVGAAEIRRSVGRRYVAPLIVASLIAVAKFALVNPSTETDRPSRATAEPINAPAFVRPAKPSPDALTGHAVRIAKKATERNPV